MIFVYEDSNRKERIYEAGLLVKANLKVDAAAPAFRFA